MEVTNLKNNFWTHEVESLIRLYYKRKQELKSGSLRNAAVGGVEKCVNRSIFKIKEKVVYLFLCETNSVERKNLMRKEGEGNTARADYRE